MDIAQIHVDSGVRKQHSDHFFISEGAGEIQGRAAVGIAEIVINGTLIVINWVLIVIT